MAARRLCARNESAAENAIVVRRLEPPPLIDACRMISTEGSEENKDCNGVASLCYLLLAQSTRGALAPSPFRIYREMFVLKMFGHLPGLFHFDLLARGIQLIVRFATFRGAAH